MRKYVMLSCFCLLLLVSLVAVPVLAATVSCPSSCSCLLPAEAKKLGSSGYCKGMKAICDYDALKNEKYCYEKPGSIAAPQLIVPAKVYISTTPTTVAPQKCADGCTCLSTADGKGKGLFYCGVRQMLCGYASDKTPLYCFALPATPTTTPVKYTGLPVTTTPTTLPVITGPTESCAAGCSCLAPDKADAVGFPRCKGTSAPCSYDPLGRPMYCYMADRVTMVSPVPADGTLPDITSRPPSDQEPPDVSPRPPSDGPVPEVERRTTTPVPSDNAPPSFFSSIGSFFASLFGSPPASSSSPQSSSLQPVPCNGILTYVMTDPHNCGSCGAECGSGSCVMGQCTDNSGRAVACGPGAIRCDGTCTSIRSDENNCGNCGIACGSTEACCNGVCRDKLTDYHNCGDCGHVCDSLEVCQDGNCTCIAGITDCLGRDLDRHCTDLLSDHDNCGGCGIFCRPDQVCQDGHCICSGTMTDCGDCVNIQIDEDHCGGCNQRCYEPTPECCDGECTNNLWDENNCGACRHTCDMETGRCCDGECMDILSDEQNCGECGIVCGAEETCCHGECRKLLSDEQNCGGCGETCSEQFNTCCNGECTNLQFQHHCGGCNRECPTAFMCVEGNACCFSLIPWICHPPT